jgi:hypothetical protein
MSYSIAKMIEFAFTYIIINELKNDKHEMPDNLRQTLLEYMSMRVDEIKKQYK